jgi:DNA-binding LacI/PurR family transcriptional regulator
VLEAGHPTPQRKARSGRVSLATIAELAGVSSPTVSKVLNRRDGVGPDTRQRVEELLRDHGYRRAHLDARVPTLEVVHHHMLSSISMEILRGVTEVAAGHGHTVTFVDASHEFTGQARWIEALVQRRPAGVITVVSGVSPQEADLLAKEQIPLVALDPVGEMYAVPAVGSSNWSGALSGTRHLLELGHRRIGVLSGPVRDLSARARLDGFRAALDYAGVPYNVQLERNGAFTFESGLELGLQLLSRPEPPTAIVCSDDLQAMGVLEAARQKGLRVPQDLSVVGFDDIEQASWTSPPLTTVRQPFAEMGAAAARIVLGLADGKAPTQSRLELDTPLIVRGSTAPPSPTR